MQRIELGIKILKQDDEEAEQIFEDGIDLENDEDEGDDEDESVGGGGIMASMLFINPYKDHMEFRRQCLLEFYDLMENCVVTELGENPRMNSHEAMIECCGPEFRIGIHEYEQTMRKVGSLYSEILEDKFSRGFGEHYKEEIQEFLCNMKDFIHRDFNVEESLVHSVTGAKLIVNEKLYQDLVNSSKDELADMEQYRKELVRGRDVIIHKIRELFEARESQLEKMLEEEKRAAEEALRQAELQAKKELNAQRAEEIRAEDEERDGKEGEFSESGEHSGSGSAEDSESEGGGDSDEDSDEDGSDGDFNNYDDFEKKNGSPESDVTDYDAKSTVDTIFDEFRDKDEEVEKMGDQENDMIDKEWDRLKKAGKIEQQLNYVDDDNGGER